MNFLRILSIIFCSLILGDIIKADIELLDKPAIKSRLASKSILIDLVKNKNNILAVGERGHVIDWQSPDKWQQESVPLRVGLTAVTILSDGTKVAVGHDSAIIISEADSNEWRKVFDGYQLLSLKIALFKRQIDELKTQIESATDDELRDSMEYQLEELTYTLEDTMAEQKNGPDKPLLSVAATSNDHIYATGAYGTLLVSKDKGKTWSLNDDKVDNPDKFHLNAVTALADGRVYIVGENGLGFVSQDQGNSWQQMDMPYTGTIFGIRGQDNSPNLVAFGLQGNLMVSNDAGDNWQHTRVDTSASFLGGALDSEGRAYIVGHGGLVIDFNVNNIDDLNIRKHPSGAAFSTALIKDNALVLVGQFGIISWNLNKED